MFNQILQYFESQNWKYFCPDKDKNIAMLGISTKNGKFHSFLDVDEDDDKFVFFSIHPINIPESKRKEAALLLLTINYNLYTGSFLMNLDEGEIRFKTSLAYPKMEVSTETIEYLINSNISTMSSYFELINDFISEKISVEEAITKEKKQSQEIQQYP